MIKQFLRGIIPNHTNHALLCFNEDTADAIDDFIELNKTNKDHVAFPDGESKIILDTFFLRVKDQIRIVKNGRRHSNESPRISAVGINRGWSYTVSVSWDQRTDFALEQMNPFALLAFCEGLSVEFNKLDDLREAYAKKKEQEATI